MSSHNFDLPILDRVVLEDISKAMQQETTLEFSQPTFKTIANHDNYSRTTTRLARLLFERLASELTGTCKQFDVEPVWFTKPSFSPFRKACFTATSNTHPDTLNALVFARFWHLHKVYKSGWESGVDASFEYFWYESFKNKAFRREVLDLFVPLIDPTQITAVSVTYEYETVFKNLYTLDVPKDIYEQGNTAVIQYFKAEVDNGNITLGCSQFSHCVVRAL